MWDGEVELEYQEGFMNFVSEVEKAGTYRDNFFLREF